ncbi:MAG: SEC-C metal-binding domain-containing protein, partial [Planctomycetota bacterium]
MASFQKIDGRYYFVDGVIVGPGTFRREAPKVGRNDPCPCGSGKKHKKCCG